MLYYITSISVISDPQNKGQRLFSMTAVKFPHLMRLLRNTVIQIGWDWRLLASVIYQESRFDPNAESWAGAFGLMQLMQIQPDDSGSTEIHHRTAYTCRR